MFTGLKVTLVRGGTTVCQYENLDSALHDPNTLHGDILEPDSRLWAYRAVGHYFKPGPTYAWIFLPRGVN